MLPDFDIALAHSARAPRLETLIRLRWLALIGQTAAVLGVHVGLGFPLPLGWCLGIVALSAWLNIGLHLRYPATHRLDDDSATGLLAFDIFQLAALLALTGGLENPFSLLFLAPVMISATALPPRRTLALGLLVGILATMLAFWHLPLPWMTAAGPQLPLIYVAGILAAILLGVAFTGVYAWRVAEEARELAAALVATELVLAREQHLTQLDGLAAAAAHELGTPLATISLVAKEMERQLKPNDVLTEDVALLREQAQRCRTILSRITSLHSDEQTPFETLTVRQLIEEAAGPQRPFGVPIQVSATGDGAEPSSRRNPGLIYALGNLVDNAMDFAAGQVDIEAHWTPETVSMTILDDGPGFAPEVLVRAGDPYVTTRAPDRVEPGGGAGAAGGMGLGLFIAKTLIERSGGALTFANRPAPETGAAVRIVWPRPLYERRLPPPVPSAEGGVMRRGDSV